MFYRDPMSASVISCGLQSSEQEYEYCARYQELQESKQPFCDQQLVLLMAICQT
jgi:hypothetical protein